MHVIRVKRLDITPLPIPHPQRLDGFLSICGVCHQFHPGGPVEQVQVRRGQDTWAGSCLDPSGVLESGSGRTKGYTYLI